MKAPVLIAALFAACGVEPNTPQALTEAPQVEPTPTSPWGDTTQAASVCPGLPSADTTDTDGDGVPDACDCSPDEPAVDPRTCLTFEAERAATLQPPMQVVPQPGSSGGHFVAAQPDGEARYPFHVSQPGQYFIWARVSAPTATSDSLFISIDDQPALTWNLTQGRTWHWDAVPAPFTLDAGPHTLTVRGREAGVGIDKLFITDDPDRLVGIRRAIEVGRAWSGTRVSFDLLTVEGRQFVAFYDEGRRTTVASRALDASRFTLTRLPDTFAGWDSHNYLTLEHDRAGHVHLSGNMHVTPLRYFRSAQPFDTSSMSPLPMTGSLEDKTTYPRFFRGPSGQLLFSYRYGSSGDGDSYFNAYDEGAKKWSRLIATPLFAGSSTGVSAYFDGPVAGPDGHFHLAWVWRDTSDAATNHHVSYARSKDLKQWETAAGKPLALPLTLARSDIVDPVPAGGGVLNGNVRVGFDRAGDVVVSYHKHDANHHTQIFNARFEGGRWVTRAASSWTTRWDFGGGGSLPEVKIRVGPVSVDETGELIQPFQHWTEGSGVWLLDDALVPRARVVQGTKVPAALRAVTTPRGSLSESVHAQMNVYFLTGRGADPHASRFFLRWEALAPNRDQPRYCDAAGKVLCQPTPSRLMLYELSE